MSVYILVNYKKCNFSACNIDTNAYYLPFIKLSICNSISENSFLELLETVDKVLFGVNVTYNCSTVDKKVLLLPIH
jgi:hypothetical protein